MPARQSGSPRQQCWSNFCIFVDSIDSQIILRMIRESKMNAHTNPIFIQLEFLKIEDTRQLQLLSFVYDCLNKTAPIFFRDYRVFQVFESPASSTLPRQTITISGFADLIS